MEPISTVHQSKLTRISHVGDPGHIFLRYLLPTSICLILWIITSPVKCTVEVFEWISNFILHILMDVITYSCWDGNQSILVRGHGDIRYITSKTTPTIAWYVGESHVWQLGSIDGCHAPYVIGLLPVSTLCCLTEKFYCELTWVLQSFKSQITRLFVH